MELLAFLKGNNINFRENVPLSQMTGMNLKGTLPIVAKPSRIEEIKSLYLFLLSSSYSFEIVGGLSNTYLCESFYRDIIIQTTQIQDYTKYSDSIEVGCGYNLSKLSKTLSSEGIAGYEGFIGIPGTVGAAAINNSGAFNSSMDKVVKEVCFIDMHGHTVRLNNEKMHYETRSSILKFTNFGILTSVVLDTSRKDDIIEIENRVKRIADIRKKEIDSNRKSLGSIVAGHTIQNIWRENRIANFLRMLMYVPFKNTSFRKRAQCLSEFIALGGIRFVKHCDNIGRFCWTNNTREVDFFDYIEFIKKKSNNTVELEIEIKK